MSACDPKAVPVGESPWMTSFLPNLGHSIGYCHCPIADLAGDHHGHRNYANRAHSWRNPKRWYGGQRESAMSPTTVLAELVRHPRACYR